MAEKVEGKVYASEKPWLKYFEKIGFATVGGPYPAFPLHDIVDRHARKVPNGPAVYYEGGKTTWKELKDYSERLATALADLRVKKGDVVTIRLPNSAAFAISIWSISRTGATQLWIDPLRAKPEVIRQLNDVDCKTIIGLDTDIEYISSLKDETKLETIILASKKDYSADEEEEPKEIAGTYSFRKLIERYPPNPPKVDIDPKKDCALLRFTGGATGRPKGVMSSHYNITTCVRQEFNTLLGSKGFDYTSNILEGKDLPVVMPIIMAHLGGFEYIYFQDLALPIVLLPDNRDFNAIARAIEEYKPMMSGLVPGQWRKVAEIMKEEIPTMVGFAGSAPLEPVVKREIDKKKMVMTDGCGQSEANVINVYNLSGPILSLLPLGVAKKGLPIIRKLLRALSALSPLIRPIPITSRMLYSIMRVVLPLLRSGMKIVTEEERKLVKVGVGQPILDEDVKLIDPETGKEVPAGEAGEMYYKGPNLMLGYWPTPGKGIDEDGYLGSGDVYVMDEDGSFTVVDRTKDMVNVSGFKVYTEELDNFIAEHEAVFNAATIGLPDPDRPGSEKVKTFVQLREGYEPSKKLEEELTDLVAKNFPPYYKPKMYEFMELPLSSVDKIDKLALRKREEERRKKAT